MGEVEQVRFLELESTRLDEFLKVDLRVARVVAAEEVPEARKLLKLTLDIGDGTRTKTCSRIPAAVCCRRRCSLPLITVADGRRCRCPLTLPLVTASAEKSLPRCLPRTRGRGADY